MTTRLALRERADGVRGSLRDAAARVGLPVVDLSASPDSVVAAADGATAFRAPGGLLALAIERGAPIELVGPTVEWFVGLGADITGRTWTAGTVDDARAIVDRGPAVVKLADAKHPRFPARRFGSTVALDEAVASLGAPRARLLVTTGWLAIESEYRTFCVGREVLTVSPYLVEDDDWSPLLHTHRASFHAEAAAWLGDVLAGLADRDVPPASVLDVARLVDGRYVLLETNNPWSSGLYSCDPDAVLRCVLTANGPGADRWRWRPDPHLRYAGIER